MATSKNGEPTANQQINDSYKIAKKWKKIMEKRGTKQSWLAQKLGVSNSLISAVFVGRYAISEELRAKINSILETDY